MSNSFTAPIWYFLARRHGLAYLQVPKAASSSFRAAMCLLQRPELDYETVMAGGALREHREWHEKARAGKDSLAGLWSFTFVRHPFARFASFYRNKIAGVAPENTAPRFVRMGLLGGMDLQSVISRVLELEPSELDPHLVPQSYIVFDGERPRADFIGRLEALAEGLAVVEARAGVPLNLGRLNRSGGGAKTAASHPLDPASAERLLPLYAEDFRRFGYEP